MSDAPELIASCWTLAGGALPHNDREYSAFEFKERIEAAARAGFKGVGLWHCDLDHNGMTYVEIEFLTDWFLDGDILIRMS